jgi:hypothetical protein
MPRVIYSLLFTFEVPSPQILQLIVHIDRNGQSASGLATAVPPKQRIIDLRVGDWLRHRGKVRKITAIGVYRDAYYAEGAARFPFFSEGYEVVGSPHVRSADKPLSRYRT